MILVTGGTGLVGAHLLYNLVCNNENVRAIYRNEKKLLNVKKIFSYHSNEAQLLFKKIEWIKADLLDVPSLELAFQDISYVYHCAAFVSYEPDKYYLLRQTNIEGTANIVNLSLSFKVLKLCYVSSIATLGESENNEKVTEEVSWNPEADNSVYAITKYGAELEVWRSTQEGLKVVIVNPGVIIGPGIWKHGSGSLIKKVYKGLSHYTSGSGGYIDINDVVKLMVILMKSDVVNESFILVSENWSYKKFLQTTAKALEVKAPKKEAKPWMLELGWRLDWLRHSLTGKRRKLTKHLASILIHEALYSHAKLKAHTNFEFKPIDESIKEVTSLFLKDQNN